MATVFWCSTVLKLWRLNTWRTRGQYSYISVYIYIYTKRRRDEIQTGIIALGKELPILKHKIAYTVKTIYVLVCYVLHLTSKFLYIVTATKVEWNTIKGRATLLRYQHNNTEWQSYQRRIFRYYQQHGGCSIYGYNYSYKCGLNTNLHAHTYKY